jgi:hypothetical protein
MDRPTHNSRRYTAMLIPLLVLHRFVNIKVISSAASLSLVTIVRPIELVLISR